jgi:hypothetical protein
MEEAYNQENGVVQHINTFQRMWSSGDWVYTETDEWPVWTAKHQLSVMTVVNHAGDYPGSGAGLGDTAFNYRYQLIGNGESKIAVSPRLTMLFASGNPVQGRGFGGNGVQISLPMSVVHGKRFVSHWNVGTTIIPHQKNDAGQKASAYDVNLGNSVVWLINPRFNAFVETLWGSTEDVVAPGKTVRSQSLYINPAIRWAYNFKSGLQIVPGLGMPIGVGPSAGDKGVFLYLSFRTPVQVGEGEREVAEVGADGIPCPNPLAPNPYPFLILSISMMAIHWPPELACHATRPPRRRAASSAPMSWWKSK